MRKILNYGKHIFLENKKIAVAAITLFIVLPTAFTLYNHFALTPFESAQNKAIFQEMESSQIVVSGATGSIADIDALIAKPDYKKAQTQALQLLQDESLSEKDKRTIFVQLSLICQNTKDFSCIDKVIEQYSTGLLPFSYFYLNTAAELALAEGKQKVAKSYYKKLLTEIDKQGGQAFIDRLNEDVKNEGGTEQLNYQKIKAGASDA